MTFSSTIKGEKNVRSRQKVKCFSTHFLHTRLYKIIMNVVHCVLAVWASLMDSRALPSSLHTSAYAKWLEQYASLLLVCLVRLASFMHISGVVLLGNTTFCTISVLLDEYNISLVKVTVIPLFLLIPMFDVNINWSSWTWSCRIFYPVLLTHDWLTG